MLPDDLRHVLQQRPLGLVFDIDGTLSPIASRPEEARLYPGTIETLQQARNYADIAIITGRGIKDAAKMVTLDNITYIGNHGLEWCNGLPDTHTVSLVPEAFPYVEPGKNLLDLAQAHFSDIPGIIIEYKSVGGTIHYRLTEAPETARKSILDLLEKPAQEQNMRLVEGKYNVEIRIPLTINKGEGLRRLCEQKRLQGVLFAGDDRTDLDAILEIKRQRQEGVAAHAIVVQHPDTPPSLLSNADSLVEGVDGMAQLLKEMLRYLSSDIDQSNK